MDAYANGRSVPGRILENILEWIRLGAESNIKNTERETP